MPVGISSSPSDCPSLSSWARPDRSSPHIRPDGSQRSLSSGSTCSRPVPVPRASPSACHPKRFPNPRGPQPGASCVLAPARPGTLTALPGSPTTQPGPRTPSHGPAPPAVSSGPESPALVWTLLLLWCWGGWEPHGSNPPIATCLALSNPVWGFAGLLDPMHLLQSLPALPPPAGARPPCSVARAGTSPFLETVTLHELSRTALQGGSCLPAKR